MYYIILILLLVVSMFANIIQYRRQINLENIINTTEFNMSENYNFFNHIMDIIAHAYLNMQKIDKKVAFSHDDEVGFTFKALNTLLTELKDYIDGIKIELETEKKEK